MQMQIHSAKVFPAQTSSSFERAQDRAVFILLKHNDHRVMCLVLPVLLLENVGQGALAAVVPVEVHGHEDAGATVRALLTQTLDLLGTVDLGNISWLMISLSSATQNEQKIYWQSTHHV